MYRFSHGNDGYGSSRTSAFSFRRKRILLLADFTMKAGGFRILFFSCLFYSEGVSSGESEDAAAALCEAVVWEWLSSSWEMEFSSSVIE